LLLPFDRLSLSLMQYPKLAETILALQAKDLTIRQELIDKGELFDGYHPEMEKVHLENATTLQNIMDQIGYPTIVKVGAEASEAAWLVIQHSISKPAFMKNCLSHLELAAESEDAYLTQVAYLSDRIDFFEGRPQLYGTQFVWDEHGQLSPHPYDDLDKVNARREKLNLPDLTEQTKIIRARAIMENEQAPRDLNTRQAKYDDWRRKVGWIDR